MPVRELRAYVEQLPRVQAEAAMQQRLVIAMGSGLLKKGAQDRVLRHWERAAGHGRKKRHRQAMNPDAARRVLHGMGVDVRSA